MAEPKMELEDWLDDLCVRFIINLPAEDLSSVARICFQVEEAQWFYEDFIRPLDPTLPSMTLRGFCLRIFQHCPLLASFPVENHMRAFEEFLQYKTRVPVRGAIMLNKAMDSTVLVKGWKKGANWSFPRGKINKDEDDLDCAIREVYEETGFDIRAAGLVPKDDEVKYIEISMREQQLRLYIFRNVPMDTHFEPKTRKEISRIEWYKLSELPAFRKKGAHQRDDGAAATNANKFYMVAPFLVPLKKWVVQQKKRDGLRPPVGASLLANPIYEETSVDQAAVPSNCATATPGSGAAPAIDTFEGATRELQRLLKVQAPQDGNLQQNPSSDTSADPAQAKASALLAILQPGNMASGAGHDAPALEVQAATGDTRRKSSPTGSESGSHFLRPPLAPVQRPWAWSRDGPGDGQRHYLPQVMMPGQSVYTPPVAAAEARLLRQITPFPEPGSIYSYGLNQGRLQTNPIEAPADQLGAESRTPFPPLDSHSMSLLNALRSKNARGADSEPSNRPVRDPLTDGIARSRMDLSGRKKSLPRGVSELRALQPLNERQTPADEHRNVLLEMFKPNSKAQFPKHSLRVNEIDGEDSSLPAQTASYTVGPVNRAASTDIATYRVGTCRNYATTNLPSATHVEGRAPGGARSSATPLTRDDSEIAIGTSMHQVPGITGSTACQSTGSSVALPVHPAATPSDASPAFSRSRGAGSTFASHADSHLSSNTCQSQQQGGPLPCFPTPPHREVNAEQRSLLLSLFGSVQTPAKTTPGIEEGEEWETFVQPLHPVLSPSDLRGSTSGTGASATVSGESATGESSRGVAPSRRETQTPMTPADRKFLLGYLQTVTKRTTG